MIVNICIYLRSTDGLNSYRLGQHFSETTQSSGGGQDPHLIYTGGNVVLGSRNQTQISELIMGKGATTPGHRRHWEHSTTRGKTLFKKSATRGITLKRNKYHRLRAYA